MATRLKTVHFAFPVQAGMTNNTLTTFTQRTIYLPENPAGSDIKSVVAHFTCDDIITATGGTITTKTFNLRLGAAAYTSVANANTLTNSGENLSLHWVLDYTSHFVSNWSGTSMTCDFQAQINQSTGTTTGMVNCCVTLEITYEYDDTSTTQIKTVMIPLDAPVGAVGVLSTTYDTFPALDTYLPEASKSYRDIFVVVQGNEHRNAATTDHAITIKVGTTSVTTGNYEGALATDRFFRYVFDILEAGFSGTGSTQVFQVSASVGRVNHFQAYAVVTYEFNESTTTSVINSVLLPMEVDSPMGGTTSSDYQRATREFWIQEPGTISNVKIAYYAFWQQLSSISTLNFRIGTGSFVAYTDTASVLAGNDAAMVRNDSAFTLARGRNTLNFDCYRSDATDFGWNISGFWLINYTSDKSAQGVGAHNHTVFWGLQPMGTAAAANNWTVSATAPSIPETEHFINAVGSRTHFIQSGTTGPCGFTVNVERLAAEGGVKWENVYRDVIQSDPEVGPCVTYSQMRSLFKRWPNDQDSERMDLETARRWNIFATLNVSTSTSGWAALGCIFTYHTITYSVAGDVSGSAGGTVTISLQRGATGEIVDVTTRTGDGAYSFTWYDNTEEVTCVAYEDDTHLGRSPPGYASGTP